MNKHIKVSAEKRRFDSLSVLIQGDAVCAACCFDGQNLIFATNHGVETELVKNVISYLKEVATQSRSKNNLKNIDKGRLIKYMQSNINLMKNKTFESRFQASLDKVTYSLNCSYVKPDATVAFPLEVAEAIRIGKVIFLSQKNQNIKKRAIHAEMQILDYLYFDSRKILNTQENVYIGISKKCCANCETAIQAINSVKRVNIIEVRGLGHGFSFSADIPRFLKSDVKIKAEFLRLRKIETIEQVFNKNGSGRIEGYDQLHTPSSSVYDSISTHGESLEVSESVDEEMIHQILLKEKNIEPEKKKSDTKKSEKNKKTRSRKKKNKNTDSTLKSPARFFVSTKNNQKNSASESTKITSTEITSKKTISNLMPLN